tara:strand:+ start:51583 stop:54357 length:2775 start_codon:yes stop_codon:yes gene_type:complete
MIFKIFRIPILISFLLLSFLTSVFAQQDNIIDSTGEYIKLNSYFYDESTINKIFDAGINSINNFSDDLLVKYDKNSQTNTLKIEINDNGNQKYLTLQNNDNLKSITYNLNIIVKVIENQNSNSEDIGLLRYMVANSLLQEVDEYSSVIEPDEMDEFMVETKGTFGGLGIVIGVKNNELTVISPIEDTPAQKVGIKANDIIKRIDSLDTTGLSLTQAIKILRGEKGTSVTLYIQRENEDELIKFKIVRDIIKVNSVTSKKLENTGYIKINSFQSNSYEDFIEKLNSLRSEGISGLILDLRGNPGGLLDQAIKISNIFLSNKLIVSTRGKNSRMDIDFFTRRSLEAKYLGPLIVLIDNGSASASEIVAGALKNNNRAIVIGEKSFGKGTVQEVYEQNDGSAIKLTIAEYLNPNEYKVHKNGVIPDIEFIKAKIKDNKVFFNDQFIDESNKSKNYKILMLDENKNDEADEVDNNILISKIILNSNFIDKISFNENIKNFLMMSESIISSQATKYLENFIVAIDGYKNNSDVFDLKKIKFKNKKNQLIESGKTEKITFNIDNKNDSKINNLFVKLKSENKTLNNRFYFIKDIDKFENKDIKIELDIPDWVETGNEKIEFTLVKLDTSNILMPNFIELGSETLNLKIKKSEYLFPEVFYSLDINPKNSEINLKISLTKTSHNCSKCYLKILSRNKNLLISKRNIKLESISTDDFNDLVSIQIDKKNSKEDIGFILRFHDENTNDYFDKEISLNLSEVLSYSYNKSPSPYIIKKKNIIFSEPSFNQTILGNLKDGNLVYSSGSTNNFIQVNESGYNFWIPKTYVELIENQEKNKFVKAKIIRKSDVPPQIKLIGELNKKLTYEIIDDSKLKIINYFLNDIKIGIKETNLINEKIQIDLDLNEGRNKVSILAVDNNDFKTIKNFYITNDET